jgi:uncharacterized protein
MLKRSFVHLPGVGTKRERELWAHGVRTWEDFLVKGRSHFTPKKFDVLEREIEKSIRAFEAGDLAFFHEQLPREQSWRVVPGFEKDIAYLDIETTGLAQPPVNHSTTIAVLFRGELYLEHEYEKKKKVLKMIDAEASALCTYFGSAFDIPFLRKEFRLPFNKAHVDLCFWLRRLGYGGGLKSVQQRVPGAPQRDSMDIDGFDAVRLWDMHLNGVENALETLLSYNAEDTVILPFLLKAAYELQVKRDKLSEVPNLTLPRIPKIPFKVCPKVYAKL